MPITLEDIRRKQKITNMRNSLTKSVANLALKELKNNKNHNMYNTNSIYKNELNRLYTSIENKYKLNFSDLSIISYRLLRSDYYNTPNKILKLSDEIKKKINQQILSNNSRYRNIYNKITNHLNYHQTLLNIQNKINSGNLNGAKMRFRNLPTPTIFRNITLYNSIEIQLKDIDVYNFYGLGCSGRGTSRISSNLSNNQQGASIARRINEFSICNESMYKTLKHIFLQCATPLNPRTSEHIKNILVRVTASLNDPLRKHVFLVGHSYGGMVVNVLCKLLNTHPNVSKLHVITFGSIFISKPIYIGNIINEQYMMPNDVALRCQKIKIPSAINFEQNSSYRNLETGITWLPPTRNFNKKWYKLTGGKKEWKIHNEYPIKDLTNRFIKKFVIR
jgi:hypothetical protein